MINNNFTNILAIDFLDLDIISSMIQDCIVLRENITYLSKQRAFILLVNRFKWEEKDKCHRIYSIIRFQGVLRVKTKNLIMHNENLPLELLAINYHTTESGVMHIFLNFSGGAIIDLEVECVECVLKDLSEPWKTNIIPDHNLGNL